MNSNPDELPPAFRKAMESPGLRHPANCPCKECKPSLLKQFSAIIEGDANLSRAPEAKQTIASNRTKGDAATSLAGGDCSCPIPKRKPMHVKRREKDDQDEIEAFCKLRGWPCYRSRMDRAHTMPVGTPDFLICIGGIFVAIECKLPGNNPTPKQLDHIRCLQENRARARIIYSSKEAIDWLIEISKI